MARAFASSPSYAYIFQQYSQSERESVLEWLFERNIHAVLRKNPAALRGVLDADNDVVGAFLWEDMPANNLSMAEMLQAGLWQIPFRFGIGTLRRLLETISWFDTMHAKVAKQRNNGSDSRFVLLERMAVRPDHQGNGVGTMALRQTMQDLVNGDVQEIRLTTQEERNVTFYQRLGFQVIVEDDFRGAANDANVYRSWFMCKTMADDERTASKS